MPGEPTIADRRAIAFRNLLLPLLILMAMVAISSCVLAEDAKTPHDPITIEGDDGMDTFFQGQEGDGLSWETAYMLEDLAIEKGDADFCIEISGTTRYLVIENCLLTSTGGQLKEIGIDLFSCENVRIEGCEITGTGGGIGVVDGKSIIINRTKISRLSGTGIYANNVTDIWIAHTDIDTTGTAIIVDNSHGAFLNDLKVWSNNRGIFIIRTYAPYIDESRIWMNADVGITVENCENFHITGNEVESNKIAGIQVTASTVGEVAGNKVFDNYRGIIMHNSNSTLVVENNVTSNDVLGFRLSGCTGMVLNRNTIKSNWNVGIDLLNSNDNRIKDNTIYSHERGIVLTGSRDNEIIYNKILGNWVYGIQGDWDANTIRDNDMRANGWLRGVLFLVLGLIILGGVAATYFWFKRRRLSKEEKDKVLIRRRFPAGIKGLWPMSKVMWDEDFFNAQLATAGPQREDILRRYQKNIAAAKQMQYMAVGTMAVMLAFMAALPLIGVMNVVTTDITADNVNDVLFASSMSIAVYYLMSFMILLVFGLLFTSQLMKGDIFKLLSTLPLDNKGARRIVAYLLFRMYGPPLVVVLLAFPVGGFIITWSFAFLAIALLVNSVYLVFVTYVLVLIADATSRKIFSANASRGATAMRFLIMAGYLMAMMFMFITLDFLTTYISDLFLADRLAGGSGETISMGMSLIPFPFSGSYLISLTLMPGGSASTSIIITTLVGVVLMVGIVYAMRRSVNRILGRVARGVEHAAGGPGQVTTIEEITISTRKPRPAFLRNGLLVTSRDQGAIMYIIMPLLFPLITIVPSSGSGDTGTYSSLVPFLMYMGIMSFLVNMALSSSDASVGGLLSSLPYRVMDQYRAKWLTIVLITMVPVVIIIVVMYNVVEDPERMAALMVSMVPLLMVLASMYLVTFCRAFGEVNGKYTFFMTNIRLKLAKYVGIVALQYALVVTELVTFYVLTNSGVISLWTGIAALWAVNITLLVVLELTARRLFDGRGRSHTLS